MEDLLKNIDRIHTTVMGENRIKRNIGLQDLDAVNWCKDKILIANKIIRKGKNWYVEIDDVVITVNAISYTIITAHKRK